MAQKLPRKTRIDQTKWRLAAFLALVCLIKLVVVWQLKDQVLLRPDTAMDSQTYLTLAQRVMHGDLALGTDVYYVSPLYVYVLALVLKLAGSITAVRVAQVCLGTLTVGMIYVTTREWFGQRAAWISAGAAALTGLLTFYEILIIQSSIDAVLTAAALTATTLALKRRSSRWWIGAGAAFALATLSRPNMIVAPLAIGGVLLLQRRWRPILLLAAGLGAGLAPVVLRNVIVAHQFSLMSSQGGVMFLQGNGEGANGLFRPLPNIRTTVEGQAADTRTVAEAARGRALTNSEVSAYFTEQALDWIRRHPVRWVGLLLKKAYYQLNSQHIALPLSYPFFAYDIGGLLRLLFVGPWVLIPLGVLGLAWCAVIFDRAERRDYVVWLAFVPAYIASVALFIVSERYRLPLLVPLLVGAGAGADLLLATVSTGTRQTTAIAIGALAVLAIAANWPLGLIDGDGRGEERVHMAENMARFGDVPEAERWATLALERYPFPSLLHYRVGVQLANSGNFGPAIAHLTTALSLDPSAGPVELALAQTLDAAGNCPGAVPHYQRAAESSDRATAAAAAAGLRGCGPAR